MHCANISSGNRRLSDHPQGILPGLGHIAAPNKRGPQTTQRRRSYESAIKQQWGGQRGVAPLTTSASGAGPVFWISAEKKGFRPNFGHLGLGRNLSSAEIGQIWEILVKF